MKFVVSSTALANKVGLLSRVINKKNTLPILGDILFEVKDGKLTMTGSDSEVTMTTSIEITDQEGEGMFCVNAANLKDALPMMTEQPLTIIATAESDQRFTIQHQSGETYFPLEPSDEYPMPVSKTYNETLPCVPCEWMRDALKRTLWATGTSELRPVMCGVNFKLEDGYLDIVGTNGHVIVRSRYSCAGMVSTNRIGSFIMPNKVANILSSIVESDADFGWNDSDASIHLPECDITFRLIEGKYPNYNSVFPQDLSELKEASADRSLMMNSIRKVMPFASESSGTKMLHLSLDYGKLTIAGQNADYFAGAKDTITAGYVGEPVEIGANGQYLHSMIKNLAGSYCKIKLTDATHPIVIEPNEQEDNCEVSMLIMPMLLDK